MRRIYYLVTDLQARLRSETGLHDFPVRSVHTKREVAERRARKSQNGARVFQSFTRWLGVPLHCPMESEVAFGTAYREHAIELVWDRSVVSQGAVRAGVFVSTEGNMLTINLKSLVSALTVIQRSIGAKGHFPILSGVVLDYESLVLELRGTDLDTWARVLVSVVSGPDLPPFRAVLPCRPFLAALRKMGGEHVVLTRVTADGVTDSRFQVECEGAVTLFDELPFDEYPTAAEFHPSESFVLLAADFVADMRRVFYAASTDETRYNLNCVYFDSEKMRYVATDGHRLASYPAVSFGASMLVPRAFLAQVSAGLGKKVGGALTFQHDARKGTKGEKATLRIESGPYAWTCHAIEGEFPNVDNVISPPTGRGADVDAGTFLAALRSADASIPETGKDKRQIGTPKCVLGFHDGEIAIRNVGDTLTFATRVRAIVTESAIGLDVAFNVAYLRELVEQAGDGKLRLSVALDTREREFDGTLIGKTDQGGFSPMRVDSDRSLAIVMPMYV